MVEYSNLIFVRVSLVGSLGPFWLDELGLLLSCSDVDACESIAELHDQVRLISAAQEDLEAQSMMTYHM